MPQCRRILFLAAVVLAGLLTLAGPALQAADATPPAQAPFVARIIPNFIRGTQYYFETVGEWFKSLLRLVGIVKDPGTVGGACDEDLRCPSGMSCLNLCIDDECDAYEVRCVKGPETVRVIGEFSPCGPDNVCTQDTRCRRTCPPDTFCVVTHRCLKEIPSPGACTSSEQCAASCAARGFPPIGSAAWAGRCESGTCNCRIEEFNPEAPISACGAAPSDFAYACPAGNRVACSAGLVTCLKDPAYGGQCLHDAECSSVGCAADAEPFCDTSESRCRCRTVRAESVACTTDAECSAIPCDPGQQQACAEGFCACAVTEQPPEPTAACQQASECAECPAGYTAACENNACLCQRTVENVPVACTSVEECGGVSCPAGYDKACLESKCACTRTVTQ